MKSKTLFLIGSIFGSLLGVCIRIYVEQNQTSDEHIQIGFTEKQVISKCKQAKKDNLTHKLNNALFTGFKNKIEKINFGREYKIDFFVKLDYQDDILEILDENNDCIFDICEPNFQDLTKLQRTIAAKVENYIENFILEFEAAPSNWHRYAAETHCNPKYL